MNNENNITIMFLMKKSVKRQSIYQIFLTNIHLSPENGVSGHQVAKILERNMPPDPQAYSSFAFTNRLNDKKSRQGHSGTKPHFGGIDTFC